MPKSNAWSKPSRACRVELRPSRLLAAALVAMGLLAVIAWNLSDAPAWLAASGAASGLVLATRAAARERRRAVVEVVLGEHTASVDGDAVDAFGVDWRGPLMVLQWRASGRRQRRLAFPDALDAPARRELRLWALSRRERPAPPAVAP